MGIYSYLLIINKYLFYFFDLNSGYIFSLPILPLATKPKLLFLFRYISLWKLLLALVLINFLFANLVFILRFKIINKKLLIKNIILYIALNLGFFGGYIFQAKNKSRANNLNGKIAIINSLDFKSNKNLIDSALEIKSKIIESLRYNKKIKIIIFPESSFRYSLNLNKYIINWWYQAIPKDVYILICAFREENNNKFNTMYLLYNSKIIDFYDKTCPMVFTEKVPKIFNFSFINNLFTKGKNLSSGNILNKNFKLNNLYITPKICSDFYLDRYIFKDIKYNNKVIIAAINSSWFDVKYMKKLNYLCIKLSSLCTNSEVIISDKV